MESRGHITNPSTGVAEATVIIKQTDVIHVPQAYAVSIPVPPPSAPLKATVSSVKYAWGFWEFWAACRPVEL